MNKLKKYPVLLGCLLLVSQFVNAAPPVRVPSFGPNATHWPSLVPTPFMYEAAAEDVAVSCSWSAIRDALASVTDAKAAAGVRILVAPGTLPVASDSAVLKDVGSSSWSRRVTVCPRDGYGSVVISGSPRFTRMKGVCLAGFKCNGGFYLDDCDRSAIAWSRFTGYAGLSATTAGATTTKVELSEVAWLNAETSNADALQMSAGPGLFTEFKFDGLWMPPRYYVAGTDPEPHTDTIQTFRTAGGSYDNINMTYRDCALFGSNNSVVQTGGTDGITFTHMLIAGADLGKAVYPVTPGGEGGTLFSAINGAGKNWTVTDSYIYGGLSLSNPGGLYSDQPFQSVSNSMTSANPTGFSVPISGAWTVGTFDQFMAKIPPKPTEESLALLWKQGYEPPPPPDSVKPSPPSGVRIVPN